MAREKSVEGEKGEETKFHLVGLLGAGLYTSRYLEQGQIVPGAPRTRVLEHMCTAISIIDLL